MKRRVFDSGVIFLVLYIVHYVLLPAINPVLKATIPFNIAGDNEGLWVMTISVILVGIFMMRRLSVSYISLMISSSLYLVLFHIYQTDMYVFGYFYRLPFIDYPIALLVHYLWLMTLVTATYLSMKFTVFVKDRRVKR